MKQAKNSLADLVAFLTKAQQKTVLVVGDIMLDRFVYGTVSRISPESPVPVLNIKRESKMLGGAGNVLSNLTGLKVTSHLLSVVGDDETADSVRGLVQERGADPANLIVANDRQSTIKTRFLAAHQQLLRTDEETARDISGQTETELLKQAEKLIGQSDAVILSDYGKGVLTETVIKNIILMATEKNIPVLVDPKKADYKIYQGADIVTPNRNELSQATNNLSTETDSDVVAAAETLIKESGIKSVIATRSQDGMSIISSDKDIGPVHLRTSALEVYDVSGAGDTVIAAIAASLAAGATITEAAAIANIAGGVVVAKIGTAPIRSEELQKALLNSDGDLRPGANNESLIVNRKNEGNICSWEEAAEQVQRWRSRGLRIGFTNGCFDILHCGHASYINKAREKCDRLIIGLNCDNSVKRLKGEQRPVNDEQARASLLAALGAVDMVVLFGQDNAEEDKPVKLIEKLQPEIFFKGGDYTIDQLPEASFVKSYGGIVEIMPVEEGFSTTNTIKRLKNQAA